MSEHRQPRELRHEETVHLSGSTADMQIALKQLERSVAPQLYAEALAALTLAVELAQATQDPSVSIALAERSATPAMAWLSREADRLRHRGDTAHAEALRRVVRSGLDTT